MVRLAALLVVGIALLSLPGRARACAPLQPAMLAASPRTGATDVAPASSIFVVAPPGWLPVGLTLEAAGMPAPLPTVRSIGTGMVVPFRPASFFQVGTSSLAPSTTYVLRASDPAGGAPVELTRFTTAAAAAPAAVTSVKLTGLRLWRVRYPASAIGAGWCVFDEYHGYVDLDYEDAPVPGTPPDEVIGVVELRSEIGSEVHSFTFTGGRFDGLTGDVPHPAMASWLPALMPDRVYCATITLHGRNNLAGARVGSDRLCRPVTLLDMRGPVGDGGSDAGDVADAGARPDAADAGVPTDAEQRNGGGTVPEKDKGCRFSSVAGSSPAAPWVALLIVAGCLARRRRR